MRRFLPLVLFALALSGCGVVSGAASVAGTAVSVTAKAASTAADVVTAPIR
ncbi:MAG TPA: hypothetical protein VGE72_14475 [Azospirillum sp.]